MSTSTEHQNGLTDSDYVVVGVASCYQLVEGELQPVQILEPIPSAYLETLFQGISTAYQCVQGTTVGEVLAVKDVATFTGVKGAQFCQNFVDRVAAAARTYKSRPTAQAFVSRGETRTDINYSTAKKRMLNVENTVTTEDNVRQHAYTHKML